MFCARMRCARKRTHIIAGGDVVEQTRRGRPTNQRFAHMSLMLCSRCLPFVRSFARCRLAGFAPYRAATAAYNDDDDDATDRRRLQLVRSANAACLLHTKFNEPVCAPKCTRLCEIYRQQQRRDRNDAAGGNDDDDVDGNDDDGVYKHTLTHLCIVRTLAVRLSFTLSHRFDSVAAICACCLCAHILFWTLREMHSYSASRSTRCNQLNVHILE